jgi:hypothetical protein
MRLSRAALILLFGPDRQGFSPRMAKLKPTKMGFDHTGPERNGGSLGYVPNLRQEQ